jgi:hypothetical protein
MDDPGKRESAAAEQTPPKIKAEDKPWYLLATLYGVPEPKNLELSAKNRGVWDHCLREVHRKRAGASFPEFAQSQALVGFFEAANNTVPDMDFSNPLTRVAWFRVRASAPSLSNAKHCLCLHKLRAQT